MRLLIAEDDQRLLKSLKHIFESNQYIVDAVSSGTDALTHAESGEYDGLIFDIMMPGMDGVTVLRQLRQCGISTPTLLLTAKSEIADRVEGLDAGADDYLPKPFSTPELLARVRAMLRRRDNYAPDLIECGALKLNRSTYELICEERRLPLSGKEFQIMEMLMERPNFIIPIDDFMTHIWGWDSDVDVSALWVHISNIRKKLVTLQIPMEIHFIRGVGYRLEETT